MSERVETATQVLYDAFNQGTLDAFDCKHCAVGNLLEKDGEFYDNLDPEEDPDWVINAVNHRQNIIELWETKNGIPTHSQFSFEELATIERKFLEAWQEEKKLHEDFAHDKAIQFKGLINVLDYLNELDGLETPTETYNKFLDVLNKEEKELV